MEKQARAYLLAGLTVGLWSTVASAFKLSLRYLDPVPLLLWAACCSSAVLFIIVLAQGKLGAMRRFTGRDWLRSAGMGLLSPCLYYLILFEAYDRLPGQEAQVLNYSWGIVLPLLSIPLLKQKISAASFGALLISFAGVCVVATRGELLAFRLTDPLGVALAVGSSLIWALFWIAGLRDRRDPVLTLFTNFLWGTLFVFLWALARGELAVPSAPGFLGGAYVGTFEMGLTFVFWMTALSLADSTAQVSNLIFLSPFASLVLLRFVVGEKIYASSIIGLALIIVGILLQGRLSRRPARGGGERGGKQDSARAHQGAP